MNRPPEFHIDREGPWRYRGSVIGREAMVRLFAGMLRKRGADYVLQTHAHLRKMGIYDPVLATLAQELAPGLGAPHPPLAGLISLPNPPAASGRAGRRGG